MISSLSLYTFFVFNMSYHVRAKDVMHFMEDKILHIKNASAKKSSMYLSITSAIECYVQKKDEDWLNFTITIETFHMTPYVFSLILWKGI